MKNSKANSISKASSILIVMSIIGMITSLISELVFERPKTDLLITMICLLVVGIAYKKSEKVENKE